MKKVLNLIISLVVVLLTVLAFDKQLVNAETAVSVNAYRSGDNIVISYDGPWSYYIEQSYSISGDVPNQYNSVIVRQSLNGSMESGDISPRDSWSNTLAGASGSFVCYGVGGDEYNRIYESVHYEITVPISSLQASSSSISISYNGQSFDIVLDSVDEPTAEVTPTPETTIEVTPTPEATAEVTPTPEPTAEVTPTVAPTAEATATPTPTKADETKPTPDPSTTNPDLSVTSNVVIDGSYQDWDGYPSTSITYNSTNDTTYHSGQVTKDDSNIYVHIKTASNYPSQIPLQPYMLEIDGRVFQLELISVDGSGNFSWNNNPLSEGSHVNQYGIRLQYQQVNGAQTAVTVYDYSHSASSPGDDLEFSISLSELERITGVKGDTISCIKVSNPNLGPEGIVEVGTPTGSAVGVAFMLASSGIGIWSFKKKKENDNV